jgi:anti-sigma regulatory factor (Ser/Thr protein kinase)
MRSSSTCTRLRAPAILRWTRDFRGEADQVRAARRWIADLLPQCDPLADVLLLVSELCTNAVVHTRSGEAGGRFGVAVEWTRESVRVVVDDQGSSTAPTIGGRAGDPARADEPDEADESGRGLRLVERLASDWGTASRPGRRWVWADVPWQAGGGVPVEAAGNTGAHPRVRHPGPTEGPAGVPVRCTRDRRK